MRAVLLFESVNPSKKAAIHSEGTLETPGNFSDMVQNKISTMQLEKTGF